MIAMGSPKAGNHNDLYEIEEVLKEILALSLWECSEFPGTEVDTELPGRELVANAAGMVVKPPTNPQLRAATAPKVAIFLVLMLYILLSQNPAFASMTRFERIF